jgi:ABC-type glycerol-3-phosphate transport system permease component
MFATRKTALAVWFVLLGLVILFPIYWMLLTVFQPAEQVMSYPPSLFFRNFNWNKLLEVVTKTDVLRWTFNSILTALGTVLLSLVVSVPAAYSIARYKLRVNALLLFLILITQMIPPSIMVVPLFEIFVGVGLSNRLLSLILANTILSLPIGTWILTGFFENLPREIEEAAIVDGATRMMLFYKISLPLTYPALITVSILTFFDAWNEYMYAYTFISDQSKWVGTVGIASFMGQFLTDWQQVMASSFVFSLIPTALYIMLRKYIVRGVTEGFAK